MTYLNSSALSYDCAATLPISLFGETLPTMHEATVRFLQGHRDDAERMCRTILAEDRSHSDAWNLLGMIAFQRRDYAGAAKLHRHAIAIQRNNALYHSNLGGALEAVGKLNEAAVRYSRAIRIRPDLAEAHYNLANVVRAQGHLERAIAGYETALHFKPGLTQARNNLGNIFREQGRMEEALACFMKVLEQDPACAEAQSNWGNVLRAQGNLEEAVVHYRESIALNPRLAEPQHNLAVILQSLATDDESQLLAAAARYECALAANPALVEAHHNLGCIFETLGDVGEALVRYRRAIALRPDFGKAHLAEALLLIQIGQLTEGWSRYAWRWRSPDHETAWRPYKLPLWKGSRVEAGHIFLWGEQGIGDEIMFAGWIPDTLRTNSRCVLECDRRLQPIFARSFPKVIVVPRQPGPLTGSPNVSVAAHLPTGSLPSLFPRPSTEVSRRSYLIADATRREEFRSRYFETCDGPTRPLLIGLAWHSRSPRTGRRRSIDLGSFASLIHDRRQARWISLQYGEHSELENEIATAKVSILLDRSVDALIDVDTYAAQIAALDLVITIDNATAHLAGALGVPVWLLLPFAADWRWLEARNDSPWYASMRLFRQKKRGDWAGVLSRVQQELRALHPRAVTPQLAGAAPRDSRC